ncbi:MAG: hypothetical protein KBF41_16175 [Azonexus sp.]|nr:hypothetical protein [Azonexus sp.]
MSNQLYSGQGRDINVFAGQSLAVSSITGAYTATIIAGAGIGTALATDSTGGATYGPYSGGVTIRLKAGEGALLDYEAAVNPVLNYAGPARLGYSAAGDTSSVVNGAGNQLSLNQGYRTVLYGDSMTETEYGMDVASSASYESATGILTVNYTSHQYATGWNTRIFNRQYASLLKGQVLPVTRVTANQFTVQMAANLPGLPNGALAGSTQIRNFAWRGVEGFATWFNMAAGWRFNIVFNGAQSGDTTADALARVDADCLAYNPQVVIMQMPGINDCSAGNGPVAEETTWTNQKAIIDKIAGSNATLILLNVTPVAASEAAGRATLQNMQRVIRLNRRLADYCSTKPGVILFDAWGRVVNPTDATGLAAANILRTAPDSIHYSQRGGRMIADALWAQVQQYFPYNPEPLPKSITDSYTAGAATLTSASRSGGIVTGVLTAHGFNTGDVVKVTGGTSTVFNDYVTLTRIDSGNLSFPSAGADGAVTGTILIGRNNNLVPNTLATTATGGTVASPGTGVAALNRRIEAMAGTPAFVGSVVANAAGFGNDQKVVITPGAANDQVRVGLNWDDFTTDLPAVVKAGRSYYAEGFVTLANVAGSNLSEIRFNIETIIDGITYQSYGSIGYALGPDINTDWSGHMRTAQIVLPAGVCTKMAAYIHVRFSAAGTAMTLQLGRFALREVDGA